MAKREQQFTDFMHTMQPPVSDAGLEYQLEILSRCNVLPTRSHIATVCSMAALIIKVYRERIWQAEAENKRLRALLERKGDENVVVPIR